MTKSTVRCPYVKLAVLSWQVCAILGSPAEGAAPVLPLPTVDEDRGAEKDSDEDHLDGILHAMQPCAPWGTLPLTAADPQPLVNAISVPCVIPEDMRQKATRNTEKNIHGTQDRDTKRNHTEDRGDNPWGKVFER